VRKGEGGDERQESWSVVPPRRTWTYGQPYARQGNRSSAVTQFRRARQRRTRLLGRCPTRTCLDRGDESNVPEGRTVVVELGVRLRGAVGHEHRNRRD